MKAPERIHVAESRLGWWTIVEPHEHTVEYVRADLFAALEQERNELQAALDCANGVMDCRGEN
jgi:hypothetical protein